MIGRAVIPGPRLLCRILLGLAIVAACTPLTVSAQTVSGDVETRQLAGSLRFSTVSGDLTVVDGSSDTVKAETVSGDVTLDVQLGSGGRIDVSSVSGNVTVRMPESTGMRVEVRTMSGSLDSAFDGLSSERKPGSSKLRAPHSG